MKKNFLTCVAVIAALTLVSCKSKESSYRAEYERAKALEMAEQQTSTPVTVQPVAGTTATTVTTTPVAEDNSNLRSERLTVMNGGALKAFNVVCGSFKSEQNANNLRNTLVNAGYNAQVAKNEETGMFRVIASSFDNRADATVSRDKLRATYKDAWLLYRKY